MQVSLTNWQTAIAQPEPEALAAAGFFYSPHKHRLARWAWQLQRPQPQELLKMLSPDSTALLSPAVQHCFHHVTANTIRGQTDRAQTSSWSHTVHHQSLRMPEAVQRIAAYAAR